MLAFELVAGVPPFMHEDRMVMYRRIVDGVYTCPAHFSGVSTKHMHMLLRLAGRPPCRALAGLQWVHEYSNLAEHPRATAGA